MHTDAESDIDKDETPKIPMQLIDKIVEVVVPHMRSKLMDSPEILANLHVSMKGAPQEQVYVINECLERLPESLDLNEGPEEHKSALESEQGLHQDPHIRSDENPNR